MGSGKAVGGGYAASAMGGVLDRTPQCVLNSVNLPHGFNHAAVLFKGIAHHLPGGNPPRYESSDNNIRGYKTINEGKSEATPREIRGFIEHYGRDYSYFGPGARNCQDFAKKLVDFLVKERPCHMVR